jgi:hypothetical protein
VYTFLLDLKQHNKKLAPVAEVLGEAFLYIDVTNLFSLKMCV